MVPYLFLVLFTFASSKYLPCPQPSGLFPIENSFCKSYFKCEIWQNVAEFTCPEEQNFNPYYQRCDWEDLYPCMEATPSSVCLEPTGLLPKPGSNCKMFYECINWKPYERQCPDDQLFSHEVGGCEWPELYSCEEDATTSSVCLRPNGLFPKPGSNCKMFYECIHWKPYEKQCLDDELFNHETGSCEWNESYSCEDDGVIIRSTVTPTLPDPSTTRIPTSRISEINIISTTDDSMEKTTEDKDTSKEYRTTPPVLETTPRKTVTEFETTPELSTTSVTATVLETTPHVMTSSIPTVTDKESTTGAYTTTTRRDTSSSTTSRQTKYPDRLFCPSASGLFPHPTNRHKFLACVNYIPTVMDCPDDLVYEPKLEACIWP